MILLTWNIRHGGGARVARIVEEIAAHDPDVIALTEYRARPGKVLSEILFERGWRHVETTNPSGNRNGIAVFSRGRLILKRCPAATEHHVRWLQLELPEQGFGLSVLHIPAAGSSKTHPLNLEKRRYWDAVLAAAGARIHQPHLLAGDWNTGAHHADETGKTYVCAEHFLQLSAMGWTDLWRHHNPGRTEWTWYSTLKGGVRGNGFRLDHAFATPALTRRSISCRYSHRERESGVSDHSMVLLELD